jgi:hypothetical protein
MTRIAGLPQTASERAFDMYLKVRHIQSANNGGGVVFATGTPIANSMAEMFTMQRYLQPEDLKKHNLGHFDSWAATFGEPVTAMELSPDGAGYRLNTRFARFINVPELMQIFRQSADVQTAQMLNLARPKLEGRKTGHPQCAGIGGAEGVCRRSRARAEALKRGRIDPREDNMLKITTEGRKAALDLRLMKPGLPDDPQSKVNLAVENIHQIWEATKDDRLAQLVFCDLSTPQDRGFSVYRDMADKLKRLGVPENEIAFIQDYDADNAKLGCSVRPRGQSPCPVRQHAENGFGHECAGTPDCLASSGRPVATGGRGTARGTDSAAGQQEFQRADLPLRHRRLVRCLYVADVGTKAKFIAQVMSGDMTIRRLEDMDSAALTYAEVKAIASGNPLVIEKAQVDAELIRLTRLRSAHAEEQYRIRTSLRHSHRGGSDLDGTARKLARGFDAPAGHFRRQIPHRTGQTGSGQSRRRRGIAVAAGGENQNPLR